MNFVCVDDLRPSQQFFSHVRTFSCIPGLNQQGFFTNSGNHGKDGKSRKKSSMHGKIIEFEEEKN